MDLPISAIKTSEIVMAKNEIKLIDRAYRRVLFHFDTKFGYGDYIAIIKQPSGTQVLYKAGSDYNFDTLNRQTILGRLNDRLKPYGLEVVDLTIAYIPSETKITIHGNTFVKETDRFVFNGEA